MPSSKPTAATAAYRAHCIATGHATSAAAQEIWETAWDAAVDVATQRIAALIGKHEIEQLPPYQTAQLKQEDTV